MDKLQEMKDYMQQNQLRKSMFGGYKKEDVHMKLEMLEAMLDNYVKEQKEKEEALRSEFENKLKDLETEYAEMRKSVDTLTAENEQIVQDQYRVKEAYKSYCGEIMKRYSETLDTLSGEFNKMLDNVSVMQKSISEESIVDGLDKALEMMGNKEI